MQSEKSHFEVEGRKALGFDTGLNPAAFAQAKLAQLLSERGYLVSPTGEISTWRAEGVVERDGRMTVWGPDFPGERLDTVVMRGGNAALEALRLWIAARIALAKADKNEVLTVPAPYPGAAFLRQDGTILFAPERLALRALNAAGAGDRLDGADRWVHPDLSGEDAASFTAGALAYRVLCGEMPFAAISDKAPSDSPDVDSLRADMRDGCALPALLAEGGLEAGLASLLDAALAPAPQRGGSSRSRGGRQAVNPVLRPSLSELASALGRVGSGGIEGLVRPLTVEEKAAAAAERARRTRSRDAKVGAKRFARRNATVLVAVFAATVGTVLVARSIISDRADRPTTAGMSPRQVAEKYYGAFGKLDHGIMEASVLGKAGKGDIDATMNLFVISRVRMAYERLPSVMSAEDWIAQGSKPVNATVFGVADLSLEEIESDESDGEVTLRARYDLWTPPESPLSAESTGMQPAAVPAVREDATGGTVTAQAPLLPLPVAVAREDTLTLVLHKGLWRIAAIDRRETE